MKIIFCLLTIFIFSSLCGAQTPPRKNYHRQNLKPPAVLAELAQKSVCDNYQAEALTETLTGRIVSRYFAPDSKHLVSFGIRQADGEKIDIEIDDLYLSRQNPPRLKETENFLTRGKRVKVWLYLCWKTRWIYQVQAI